MKNPFKVKQVWKYLGYTNPQGTNCSYILHESKHSMDLSSHVLSPKAVFLVLSAEECKIQETKRFGQTTYYVAIECLTQFGNKYVLISEEWLPCFELVLDS